MLNVVYVKLVLINAKLINANIMLSCPSLKNLILNWKFVYVSFEKDFSEDLKYFCSFQFVFF